MPRVKQPQSLEALALDSFGRCIESVALGGREFSRDARDELLHFLHTRLPCRFRDRAAEQVLQSVSRLCVRLEGGHCSPVMRQLVDVACRLDLRSIDLTAWPYSVRDILLSNIHCMNRLEVLKLGTEYKILYAGSGVDELLKIVGQNCPQLEHLEVNYCLSDKSVKALLQCKNLRVLLLRSFNVDKGACHQLLTGLPRLEVVEIVTLRYQTSVIKALKALQRSGRQLHGLHSLTIHIAKQKHLKVVHAVCPRLEKLGLILSSNYKTDSVPFQPLTITDLSLQINCNVYNSSKRFRKLLGVVGFSLSTLKLDCLTHCSVNLAELSHLCPNLRTMNLACYRCVDVPSTAILFPNLEQLEIDQKDYNILYIEPVLRSCLGIRRFSIRFGQFTHCFYSVDRIVLSDAIVANILAANPMVFLEEFTIRGESRLTIKTVRLLMASCHSLRKLVINDVWHMSQEDLTSFKDHLQENNVDLGVYYFKYFV